MFGDSRDSNAPQTLFNARFFSILSKIHRSALAVLRCHSAIEIPSPLLLPASSRSHATLESPFMAENNKRPVLLLDASGMVVQLPYDLTLPFARHISKIKTLNLLKRYTFSRVYRPNVIGGQPQFYIECDFDVITKRSNLIVDAEVIKVAFDILESCGFEGADLKIRLNHFKFLEVTLKIIGISEGRFAEALNILESLERPFSLQQVRN
ncbi:hypothetical protein BC829DRAFT_165277 [Chytridium lagenaria]|nr:hypothetical protein BC829DRAFT_165277 [Chytridium lagenaria]